MGRRKADRREGCSRSGRGNACGRLPARRRWEQVGGVGELHFGSYNFRAVVIAELDHISGPVVSHDLLELLRRVHAPPVNPQNPEARSEPCLFGRTTGHDLINDEASFAGLLFWGNL